MADMITTCPGCGTAFRVTPAQLQARQGLVRCGRCARVFNAFASRAPGAAPRGEAPAAPAPAEAPMAQQGLPAVFRSAHGQPPAATAAPPSGRAAPEPERPPEPEPPPAPETVAPAGFELEPVAAAEAAATVPADEAPPPRLRFNISIPEPEEPPEPRRRGWVWGLAALPLALLVAAQAAWLFRTEIAVLYPPGRPWLEAYCRVLGCSVPLPQRPEYLEIAGSDLRTAERSPGRIAFEATLRNLAPFPQAYPALELTLTDARDQPVARRVFNPGDYLGAGARSEAGIDARGELTVRLDLDIGDIRATGYRVYLFYPARG